MSQFLINIISDAPHNHLGTRAAHRESRRASPKSDVTQGFRKKSSEIARGLFQYLVSPKDYAKSARELARGPRRPDKIPDDFDQTCRRIISSHIPEDHGEDLACPRSPPRYTPLHSHSPSINIRRQGERKSVPQLPDVTELLDVVVLALG
ncbi:hypothetical protein F511_17707 [Dorcoceras hygrometricum]|uniref:Uncharacterized protein n=1 Tax=Dorcoceras hygrometricum TaxID=472368 RepID=A0A2Z7C0Y2_9LAMI|nr:hypothetical protein F511_17707 [Dorcoceras hygrometricum]